MGAYATVADLRADPTVPDAAPPDDATLEGYIRTAELAVERLIGPRGVTTVGAAAGYKYDPARLPATGVDALREAVVVIAAELVRNPEALDRPRAQSISGPDFSMTNIAGVAPAAARALEAAVAILDNVGLRVRFAHLGMGYTA